MKAGSEAAASSYPTQDAALSEAIGQLAQTTLPKPVEPPPTTPSPTNNPPVPPNKPTAQAEPSAQPALPGAGGATNATTTPAVPAKDSSPAASPSTEKVTPANQDQRPVIKRTVRQRNAERDANIIKSVARLMQRNHYLQRTIDAAMSEKILRGYMEYLDYNHLIFLQSDFEEFNAKYGKTLGDFYTRGDAAPAFNIFNRFLERLEQRTALIDRLVKDKYDFSSSETYQPDREKASWPKDDAEAETLWRSRVKLDLLAGRLEKTPEETVIKRIVRRHNNLLKDMGEYDDEEVVTAFLNAMTRVYDPHSDYMNESESQNFRIQMMDLKLTGIGAELRTEDGYAKVVRLVPGGPAEKDKRLKPNDRIVAVAQGDEVPVDVIDMKLQKVVEQIRGPKGSTVRLYVLPAGAPESTPRVEITIKRDEIKLVDQKATGKVFDVTTTTGEKKIGYVSLPSFYRNTSDDVEKLIIRLKKEKVSGIILDLRRNGGGLLDEAVDLTGLFIRRGPVVQVKDSYGRTQTLQDSDSKIVYDGPLIVLVGHLSASASEIVAGALQDMGRAVIVGDKSTHGKGTVQNLIELKNAVPGIGDCGNLKITVQKFFRISGGSTQVKGVESDINLPSLYDYYDMGEAKLPNSLPYDVVEKVPYVMDDKVKDYLPRLRESTQARVKQSQDFKYVQEDIDRWLKKKTNLTISLNEADRIKEKDDIAAQTAARKKERAARSAAGAKVLDLSLEAAEKNLPLVEPKKSAKSEPSPIPDPTATTSPEDKDDDSAPTFDPQLDESLNIMGDYIDLLNNKGNPETSTVKK
ncbi:MAG TPA: carboxy terminal-processing peptidase [Candidatus Methylacidiphilales bacterium]|nr:carboxy terminal-processing peptidase [Candidatus Methylacidiphilales bacterium]